MDDISREEVANLIEGLKFRDKIDYLLKNPELESKKLTILDSLFSEREFYPNCFGTVLFLLGAERDFLKSLRYKRRKDNGFISISVEGSFVIFHDKFDRPGSLAPQHMKLFMRDVCRNVKKSDIGCIVITDGVVYDNEGYPEEYQDPIHSAIYLGEQGGKEYIFEQSGNGGNGGRFKFDLLENMVNRAGIRKSYFHSYY